MVYASLIQKDDEAVKAARILGIDFAPALVGFEFHGRHGTAVLKGVVVAAEFRPAMEAAIGGLRDDHRREVEEAKSEKALKMWKHYMMSLRIKQRVDTYRVEGEDETESSERNGDEAEEDQDYASERAQSEDSQEDSDHGGGGFLPE